MTNPFGKRLHASSTVPSRHRRSVWLMVAAANGATREQLKLLFRTGANPNYPASITGTGICHSNRHTRHVHETPLSVAIKTGNFAAALTLINNHADATHSIRYGKGLPLLASNNPIKPGTKLNLIDYLLLTYEPIYRSPFTPQEVLTLITAISKLHRGEPHKLISPHTLSLAIHRELPEVIDMIVKLGGKISAKHVIAAATPYYDSDEAAMVLKKLLEHCPNGANIPDERGCLPGIEAAKLLKLKALTTLIAAKLDQSTADENGSLAHHIMTSPIQCHHKTVFINLLARNNFPISLPNQQGKRPIELAFEQHDIHTVLAFLKNGVVLNPGWLESVGIAFRDPLSLPETTFSELLEICSIQSAPARRCALEALLLSVTNAMTIPGDPVPVPYASVEELVGACANIGLEIPQHQRIIFMQQIPSIARMATALGWSPPQRLTCG